eukprot:194340-Chlamydomonas_euryale.AAC.4
MRATLRAWLRPTTASQLCRRVHRSRLVAWAWGFPAHRDEADGDRVVEASSNSLAPELVQWLSRSYWELVQWLSRSYWELVQWLSRSYLEILSRRGPEPGVSEEPDPGGSIRSIRSSSI